MAILPSEIDKLLVEETDFDSNVTEALAQKIGKNINYLIDKIAVMATGTSVGIGGIAYSNSSGIYSIPSAGTVYDVPNLAVSIETSGRPVFIGLIGETTVSSNITITETGGANAEVAANIGFLRDLSVQTFATDLRFTTGTGATGPRKVAYPPSAFWTIEYLAAGTYSYKVQASRTNILLSNSDLVFQNVKLVAYEL